MKTKPESDLVLITPKRDNSPTICKNDETLDLTDARYLRTSGLGIEHWVHKDDYDFYYNLYYHRYDNLKEWNGTEDHQTFVDEFKKSGHE